MRRRPVVIAYDVSCNKRRRKVFRCLESWRLSAQYSVFECKLNAREAEELFLQLTDLIHEDEDTLLLAWLDQNRKAKAVTKAAEIGFHAPSYYIG